jgi:hypothetical protein
LPAHRGSSSPIAGRHCEGNRKQRPATLIRRQAPGSQATRPSPRRSARCWALRKQRRAHCSAPRCISCTKRHGTALLIRDTGSSSHIVYRKPLTDARWVESAKEAPGCKVNPMLRDLPRIFPRRPAATPTSAATAHCKRFPLQR